MPPGGHVDRPVKYVLEQFEKGIVPLSCIFDTIRLDKDNVKEFQISHAAIRRFFKNKNLLKHKNLVDQLLLLRCTESEWLYCLYHILRHIKSERITSIVHTLSRTIPTKYAQELLDDGMLYCVPTELTDERERTELAYLLQGRPSIASLQYRSTRLFFIATVAACVCLPEELISVIVELVWNIRLSIADLRSLVNNARQAVRC